jgi:hypothetical protein
MPQLQLIKALATEMSLQEIVFIDDMRPAKVMALETPQQ